MFVPTFSKRSQTFKMAKKLGTNKKRSHTQLDSRKQVIAFQDRVKIEPSWT